MSLQFDSDKGLVHSNRLAQEFTFKLDNMARVAVEDLSQAMLAKYGVDITITCVLRDQKENAAVGGVPDSAHLTKRAVDIRSRTLTQEQITWALAYVKARWSNLIHIIYHNGGTGPHIHLNLNFPFAKEKAIKAADMALPKPA